MTVGWVTCSELEEGGGSWDGVEGEGVVEVEHELCLIIIGNGKMREYGLILCHIFHCTCRHMIDKK